MPLCALQAAAAALPELAVELAADELESEVLVSILSLSGLRYVCLWALAQSSYAVLCLARCNCAHAIRCMP